MAFRLMMLTVLVTSATAEVKYTLCPVMQLSPKKSPEPRMPRTAPRPRLETDELHNAFIDVMNVRALFALRNDRLARLEFGNFLRRQRR